VKEVVDGERGDTASIVHGVNMVLLMCWREGHISAANKEVPCI
jgi:hypothetical protein